MKINYKKNKHKEVAEAGDLIKFDDGGIGLVLRRGEIALLKFAVGSGWFTLATGYKENLKEGNYKIIAKAEDWEINVK